MTCFFAVILELARESSLYFFCRHPRRLVLPRCHSRRRRESSPSMILFKFVIESVNTNTIAWGDGILTLNVPIMRPRLYRSRFRKDLRW